MSYTDFGDEWGDEWYWVNLKSAWDYCVKHNETTLGDFFSEIDSDVYAVTAILTVAWFIVSIIVFVISEYGG